jgi:hypothetical protein
MPNRHYPVREVCRALRCSRSDQYDHARRRDETSLKTAIERLEGGWPSHGYRRITALFRREGFQYN